MTESWERAHKALVRIARRRAALDREEGRWLLVAYREQALANYQLGWSGPAL